MTAAGPGGAAPSRPLAVVTGASRGLGRTLAEFLAARGYDLILTSRSPRELALAAESVRSLGARVRDIPGDVAEPRDRAKVVATVGPEGPLDLLVNNASELGPSPLPALVRADPAAFGRVFEVNVTAPVALTAELHGPLARAQGLVVNISSDAAVGAYPGWGIYGASKAALDLASRTLAAELAASHISVVSVDPGDMRTAMHQAAYAGEDISDRPLPEVTLPFFAWLLGQDRPSISGQRFRAQAETWEVSAR